MEKGSYEPILQRRPLRHHEAEDLFQVLRLQRQSWAGNL